MLRIKNLIPVENYLTQYGVDLRDEFKNVVLRGVKMNQNKNPTSDYQHLARKFLENPNKFLFIEYSNLKANGFNAKWLNFNQQETTLFNE